MNWELFAAFLAITAVLVITPGPVVMLVIATGAREGTRAALTTVVGTTLGDTVLLAAIAFGLSWVVRNAATLFEVLRWAGAAYLIWLGIQAWRHAGEGSSGDLPRGHVHVWRGFAVALSNPKTIAFFTAFLPQFVDPTLPVELQLAVMCAVSVVLAVFADSAWAIAAGLGRTWFMQSSRAKLLGRLSCVALIGGGLWLLLALHVWVADIAPVAAADKQVCYWQISLQKPIDGFCER